MRYGDAFAKLGYRLEAPRQDWTAENTTGVCITLWRSEIDWPSMVMDSRFHGGPLEVWRDKPGNRKGIRHAKRSLDECDGWVDVVIVSGTPGGGVEDASPWIPNDRNGLRWKVTHLESDTGHIRLEASKP